MSITRRSNGKWRARYRDSRNKEYSRHFDRKIDAQRWLDSVITAKHTGTYVNPDLGKVTIQEWSVKWIQGQQHLKPSTLDRYAGIVRTHILPQWGHVPLSNIVHSDVQTWVSGLSVRHSASTARKAHRVLSLMLKWAVADGRIARNPADGIGLPRERAAERIYLSHQQVAALARACGTPTGITATRRDRRPHPSADYELAVLFLAYTGVRFGELAALRIRRVDLDSRTVLIADSVTSVNGVLKWGTPKGHEARRVSLPRFLTERLATHLDGRDRDELVFTSPLGEPLRAGNFRRDVFTPAAKAIGLQGLVPHGLRHTAASLAIAAGADVKVVQQMLGHKSATMTLDLYGHLFNDRIGTVADALDAAVQRAQLVIE